MPLAVETDYDKALGNSWEGNAAVARARRDGKYGAAHIVELPGAG